MTAPKPFPFPIGIGTDICRVNRIAAILRHEYIRNRWARKIFTRLEWPALCRRLQRVEKAVEEPVKRADVGSDARLENTSGTVMRFYDNSIWMLPSLSGYSSIFEDENLYWSTVADERSALGALARHLAGRWAAKEAVIKAHRNRRLYIQNISIVRPSLPPGSLSGTDRTGAQKLIALINPPCDRIEMTPHVAKKRGLRGFVSKNLGLHKGPLMTRDERRKVGQDEEAGEVVKGAHYYRRSRIKDPDRQVAEINISHDGDYAVAVCMAFDPPDSMVQEQTIVDTGEGLPLHEPQWGDEGWLDLATPGFGEGSFKMNDESVLDIPLASLLDEPASQPNPDVFKKSFRRIFRSDNIPPLP